MKKQILWQSDKKYAKHRIPGLFVSGKGTVFAYTEARCETDDWAKMDILLKRSDDGGKTWSEDFTAASGTDERKTVNNPVMLEDRHGKLHLLYCEDYGISGGRILRIESEDDGKTWSSPFDITAFTSPEIRNVFALGPGHGITLQNGDLLVPCWLVLKKAGAPEDSHFPSVASSILSRDDGKTWEMGEFLPESEDFHGANETVAAQTTDGKIYFSVRIDNTCRGVAFSKDGLRFDNVKADENLSDPRCFGSVSAVENALLFVNCDDKEERKNVTVKKSLDGGKSWKTVAVLDKEEGGYADIQVDFDREQIYVLYEKDWGDTLTFVTLSFAEASI